MLDPNPPLPNTADRPRGIALWWRAVRPPTLALSASPVVVGGAWAWSHTGDLRWDATAVALGGAMAIQAGTNLFNDAADSLNGTDTGQRLGPPRLTQRGWATAAQVARASHVAFALAFLGGLYLAWVGGLPILLLGLASIAAGYAYSAGPMPLSRTPLGELFVIGFFGIGAVWGSQLLTTGATSPGALLTGFAVGLPAAAVLLVNNVRDRLGDARGGRRTLAIVVGRAWSVRLYALFLAAPVAALAGGTAAGIYPPGGWAILAVLPLIPAAVRALDRAEDGPAYNACLGRTVRFHLLFCFATAIGLGLIPG